MRSFVLITVIIILISGSSQSRVSPGSSELNVFDARQVHLGSKVAGQIIKKHDVNSDEDNFYYAVVLFEGEMIVEGQIQFFETDESTEGWGLGNFFTPDESSVKFIPVLNTDKSRVGFTIEDNQDKELALLKETGKRFKVRMKVKDFELYDQGKAQENKVKLVNVLKAERID